MANLPKINPETDKMGITCGSMFHSQKLLLEKISSIKILETITKDDLEKISRAAVERNMEKGSYLMHEGEDGAELFFILKGRCVVQSKLSGRIVTIEEGGYCGEQALLYKCKRTASVVCETDVVCLVLDKTTFQAVLGKDSYENLFRKFSYTQRKAVIAHTVECSKASIERQFAPKHINTPEILKWLYQCVSASVIFEGLSVKKSLHILNHMERREIATDTAIITQGEIGYDFFVVESGKFSITVNNVEVDVVSRGSCCGELALIYNSRRSATVRSLTESVVWVVHNLVFRKQVQLMNLSSYQAKINKLESMSTFGKLGTEMLKEILDKSQEITLSRNKIIVKKGDVGLYFYMILNGSAKYRVADNNYGDLTLQYFGELALLNTTQRRTADVISKTTITLIKLHINDFKKILGSQRKEFLRNAQIEYKTMKEAKRLEAIIMSETEKSLKARKTESRKICELKDLVHEVVLGKGAFGFVTLVKDPKTNKQYALKAICKHRITRIDQQKIILREKLIMNRMCHPRLVSLYRTYQNGSHVFYLLDACPGGELFAIFKSVRLFSESTTRFYAGCVIEAFDYMHKCNIVYRDLKPENLVLETNGYIKLTDFGFAKYVTAKTYTLCGTPDYLAPEIVLGKGHSISCDWWSFGVFIYEMLSSVSPFYSNDPLLMYRNIVRVKYKIPSYFSKEVSRLIYSLFRRADGKRLGSYGTDQLYSHEWFKGFKWEELKNNTMVPPMIGVNSPVCSATQYLTKECSEVNFHYDHEDNLSPISLELLDDAF